MNEGVNTLQYVRWTLAAIAFADIAATAVFLTWLLFASPASAEPAAGTPVTARKKPDIPPQAPPPWQTFGPAVPGADHLRAGAPAPAPVLPPGITAATPTAKKD